MCSGKNCNNTMVVNFMLKYLCGSPTIVHKFNKFSYLKISQFTVGAHSTVASEAIFMLKMSALVPVYIRPCTSDCGISYTIREITHSHRILP